MDGYFFRHFGLNKNDVLAAIRTRVDDAAVAEWFLAQPGAAPDRIAAWNDLVPLLGVKGHPAYLTRLIVTPFLYPKARHQPVDSLFAAIAQDENLPPQT